MLHTEIYSSIYFSFNLCAATLLKKGLKRASDMLTSSPESFHRPTQSTIDAILASSMGDIRCAMNQLYLACIVGKCSLKRCPFIVLGLTLGSPVLSFNYFISDFFTTEGQLQPFNHKCHTVKCHLNI